MVPNHVLSKPTALKRYFVCYNFFLHILNFNLNLQLSAKQFSLKKKIHQYLCYIVISFFSLTLTPLLLQQTLPSDTRPAQSQLTLTPLLLQQTLPSDTRPAQPQLTLTPLLLQQTLPSDTRPAQPHLKPYTTAPTANLAE